MARDIKASRIVITRLDDKLVITATKYSPNISSPTGEVLYTETHDLFGKNMGDFNEISKKVEELLFSLTR